MYELRDRYENPLEVLRGFTDVIESLQSGIEIGTYSKAERERMRVRLQVWQEARRGLESAVLGNPEIPKVYKDAVDACQEMHRTLRDPSRQLLDSTRRELDPWIPMLEGVLNQIPDEETNDQT